MNIKQEYTQTRQLFRLFKTVFYSSILQHLSIFLNKNTLKGISTSPLVRVRNHNCENIEQKFLELIFELVRNPFSRNPVINSAECNVPNYYNLFCHGVISVNFRYNLIIFINTNTSNSSHTSKKKNTDRWVAVWCV